MKPKIQLSTPLVVEKLVPAAAGNISGDKAYLPIRCETKILVGELDVICGRGRVLK